MLLSKQMCPYCGERVELLIDSEMVGESYIEDCFVCCRPMVITLAYFDGDLVVSVKTENEV